MCLPLENTNLDVSIDLSFLISGSAIMLACGLFVYHIRSWIQLQQDITDFSRYGLPKDFTETVKKNTTYSRLYLLYCLIGAEIYCILEISHSTCLIIRDKFSLCSAVLPVWLPFVSRGALVHTILFCYQATTEVGILVAGITKAYILGKALCFK